MKNRTALFLTAIALFSIALAACEKKENELSGTILYNPYEENNGVEIMAIDSMNKFYGGPSYLKGYFHLNTDIITDTSIIQRVILYRDGVEKARLSPGNHTFFVDITALVGGTYDYQLSLLMKDSSYTKLTQSYVITF